jgi:1,4-dihydroxy-2-naphthoyl-CoA hydrolase
MNWTSTDLDAINRMCKNTLMEHLNIQFDEITSESISAIMPVNKTTHQPMGLLHGGANVVLIESLGSMASALLCDIKVEAPVGLEVNANHLKSVTSGFVKGIAKPIHIGKSTHVWHVDIVDLNNPLKLLCTGRLTVLIKQIKA